MTTDTDTLIATVREDLLAYKKVVQPTAWEHGVLPSETALASLAAELEAKDVLASHLAAAAEKIGQLEAELERVKAERDEALHVTEGYISPVQKVLQLQARLDKALTALRKLRDATMWESEDDARAVRQIARAAIQEIEE